MEAQPAHRVLVHAKGDYDFRSDKLEVNGQQIELDAIQFKGVATKEDCLKSHARREYISIYMIDEVFSPFVELLRRNAEIGLIIVNLDARKCEERPDVLRLSFDGMDMTRNAGISNKELTQILADAIQSRLTAHLKRAETLLFAIAVMTGLISLHFLFK
jgi:hypothetical protein